MNNITSHNSSTFLWTYRAIFLPISLALPFVFQISKLAIKIFNDPHIVPKKLSCLKQLIIHSFSKKENETQREFKKRLLKNVLITLVFTQLLLGGVAAPFCFLPAIFAIPIAISTIFFMGDFALNAEHYLKKFSAKWIQTKNFIKNSFTPRSDETSKAAALRIIRNIAIATVTTAAVVGICFALHQIAIGILHAIMTGTVGKKGISIWNLYKLLPSQTPLVVFFEYISLGIIHGGLAIKKLKEGKKGEALFHLVNFILGVFFPFYYQFYDGPIRLHHSFFGLLISLAPADSLKIYGSLTTLDSFAYLFHPFRGYWSTNSCGTKKWHQWDFQNLVLKNFSKYFAAYFTATTIEIALKNIFRKNESVQRVAKQKAVICPT